ncbi:MAG: hypothetical protein M3464_19810 [Chloroflexota bacterium]|nr:hypothetical protein [Chloroflexota bacterium]
MIGPGLTVGLIGDGPIAGAYQEAVGRIDGVALVSAPVDALLADADITAVIIAAPVNGWAAITAAVGGGKHVLVDPALVGSPGELAAVLATAAVANGSVLVARPWRWHEVCRSLQAAVDAGDLGPPAFFQWVSEGCTVLTNGGPATKTTPGLAAIIGLDLGLSLLGGEPARVYARSIDSGGRVVSIRFANGANALIEWRADLAGAGASYGFAWLLGPRGEARWEQRAADLVIDGDGAHLAPLDFRPSRGDAIMHAVACWRGEEDLAQEVNQARALLASASAMHESLRRGQPVDIDHSGMDAGR